MNHQDIVDGQSVRQSQRRAEQSGRPAPQPASPSPAALWNEAQAAAFYGVSGRKFAEMRAANMVPEPVVLGPRALRWIPEECHAAALTLPRLGKPTEPAQLARARIERMKAGA